MTDMNETSNQIAIAHMMAKNNPPAKTVAEQPSPQTEPEPQESPEEVTEEIPGGSPPAQTEGNEGNDRQEKIAKLQAMMNRKDRQWSREKRELRKEIDSLRSQTDQFKERASILDLAEKDPLAFMEKTGLTPDRITSALAESGKTEEQAMIDRVLNEVKSLKDEREQEKKAQEERQRQEQVESSKRQLRSFIDNDQFSDKFEGIKVTGSYDDLFGVVTNYINENRDNIGPEDVEEVVTNLAELYEDELEDKIYNYVKSSKKFQKKLKDIFQAKEEEPKNHPQEKINLPLRPKSQIKKQKQGLTNAQPSTAPMPGSSKPISPIERRQWAIQKLEAAMKGS